MRGGARGGAGDQRCNPLLCPLRSYWLSMASLVGLFILDALWSHFIAPPPAQVSKALDRAHTTQIATLCALSSLPTLLVVRPLYDPPSSPRGRRPIAPQASRAGGPLPRRSRGAGGGRRPLQLLPGHCDDAAVPVPRALRLPSRADAMGLRGQVQALCGLAPGYPALGQRRGRSGGALPPSPLPPPLSSRSTRPPLIYRCRSNWAKNPWGRS